MQITRFALVLLSAGALAIAASMTACGGTDASSATTKSPTDPDDGDEGDAKNEPAKDAGSTKQEGSGSMNRDAGPSDASKTTAPTCAANGAKAIAITPNHGAPHTLADLLASDFAESSTDDKQYDLTEGGGGGGGGSGKHAHSVTLTGADRARLAKGETIEKSSSSAGNNSHTHVVTFGCK